MVFREAPDRRSPAHGRTGSIVNPSLSDMAELLALRSSASVRPLAGRAVAIGRLPDCDLILGGDEVSRRHARVVPTPEGPLLVDRSRFGTLLNGEQVVAPTLLRIGATASVRFLHHLGAGTSGNEIK